MSDPTLLVIAGCNGSGKSSFSKALFLNNSLPYDYDQVYLEVYNSLRDSELRDRMAHNLSSEHLRKDIEAAIANKANFCYETNFNSTPVFWPTIFKQENYQLELAFFCLDSVKTAKERVRIRVESGGHFVPDNEIEERYRLGYKNLDENWKFFDTIRLFETSRYGQEPKHFLTINEENFILFEDFPTYLDKLIPDIAVRVERS